MDPAEGIHLPLVVNALGHVAGVVVFGVFLYLLWRSNRRDPRPGFWLPATAATLALLWNAGSLAVLMNSDSASFQTRLTVAFSFAVLSVLPGVLLQLSLGGRFPLLLAAGYALSFLSVVAHLSVAFGVGPLTFQFGLLLITYGFGILSVIAAVLLAREHTPGPGASMRILAAMALLLFAASFVHFGSSHGPDAWADEILIHHAGIPLALFVLLQDYRFLLLDVFVRFLGGLMMAVAMAALVIALASALGFVRLTTVDGPNQALLITMLSLAFLLFPVVRLKVQSWAEAVFFRRGDLDLALARIRQSSEEQDREEEFLDKAAAGIANFVKAKRWALIEDHEAGPDHRTSYLAGIASEERLSKGQPAVAVWAEAVVPLRLGAGDIRTLLLGGRLAGQRYLSEDLSDLDLLAAEVTGQIEHKRRAELHRLMTEAELNALRAQINPHFLFNSLNALYGVIPRAAVEARKTLVSLADIFRYLLQGKRQFVSLNEELRIVEAYLQIERLRLGDRLRTEIHVSDAARLLTVPVLSIQPLVENAVKHGVSVKPEGGVVRLEAQVANDCLRVEVSDDGPGIAEQDGHEHGHGLSNVRRRLQLCFGDEAELTVQSSGSGVTAGFSLPARSCSSSTVASESEATRPSLPESEAATSAARGTGPRA